MCGSSKLAKKAILAAMCAVWDNVGTFLAMNIT